MRISRPIFMVCLFLAGAAVVSLYFDRRLSRAFNDGVNRADLALATQIEALSGALQRYSLRLDRLERASHRKYAHLENLIVLLTKELDSDASVGFSDDVLSTVAGDDVEVYVPPEKEDIVQRIIKKFNEHDEWTIEGLVQSPMFEGMIHQFTDDQREQLRRILFVHKLGMQSLWEKHYSLLDLYVSQSISSGEYSVASDQDTAASRDRGRIIASVTHDQMLFEFSEHEYPDLADLRLRFVNARSAKGLELVDFFELR